MQSLRLLNNWLLTIRLCLIWQWKHNPYFYTIHTALSFTPALKINKILNWANAKNPILFSVISFFIHGIILIREGLSIFPDIGGLFFILYHFAIFYETILTLRLVLDWNPCHNPQDSFFTNTIVRLTDPYFCFFSLRN